MALTEPTSLGTNRAMSGSALRESKPFTVQGQAFWDWNTQRIMGTQAWLEHHSSHEQEGIIPQHRQERRIDPGVSAASGA
jgi:hypothetical protein